MLKRGWSLKHAQERAHHADIRTTGNTYSHITPDMNRDVNQDLVKAFKLKVNTGEVLEFRLLLLTLSEQKFLTFHDRARETLPDPFLSCKFILQNHFYHPVIN